MSLPQPVWKKSRRKRLDSAAVVLPTEFGDLSLCGDPDELPEGSDNELHSSWEKFCTSETTSQQLTALKEVEALLHTDDVTVLESQRHQLQQALVWLLLHDKSSQQLRCVTIQVLLSLEDPSPALERALCALLSTPPSLELTTPLAVLEFLADHPLGRTVLLRCLQTMMEFIHSMVEHHSQHVCGLTSPVELAAAAGPAKRCVRLVSSTLQALQPHRPAYPVETAKATRTALLPMLTLPTLPWDLRNNCGTAYVHLCHVADDTDIRATVIQAAFGESSISVPASVPVCRWPLPAQLALLAGMLHVLPPGELTAPACAAAPHGALVSLLLGWITARGVTISDTSLILGFSRAALSALGRISQAARTPGALDLPLVLPEVLLHDLLQYVWRLMGDDSQSVRGIGGDLLTALVSLFSAESEGAFLSEVTAAAVALPVQLARRCRALRCLLPALGVPRLLAACPQLPSQLVTALTDPVLITHAADLYCLLVTEHAKTAERDIWLRTWVDPLFDSETLRPAPLSQITKKITQLAPSSVAYVVERITARPRLPRYLFLVLLTVVQSAHRQGALKSDEVNENWRGVLPMELLKEALKHRDDEVRTAALSVIVDSQKTSALLQPEELNLVVLYVGSNLTNQTPAFRQNLLALLKKFLIRLEEGTNVLLRRLEDAERRAGPAEVRLSLLERLSGYERALRRLFELCFRGLFPGANFPRRCTSLQLLSLIESFFGTQTSRPVMVTAGWWRREHLLSLLHCLSDCYENNKSIALQFLKAKDLDSLQLKDAELRTLLSSSLSLASSPRPPDPVTAAYLLLLLLQLPGAAAALRRQLAEERFGPAGAGGAWSSEPAEGVPSPSSATAQPRDCSQPAAGDACPPARVETLVLTPDTAPAPQHPAPPASEYTAYSAPEDPVSSSAEDALSPAPGDPACPASDDPAAPVLEDAVSSLTLTDSAPASSEVEALAPTPDHIDSSTNQENALSIPTPEDTAFPPAPVDTTSSPTPANDLSCPALEDSVSSSAPQDAASSAAPNNAVSSPAPQEAVSSPTPQDTASSPAPQDAASSPAPQDAASSAAPEDPVSVAGELLLELLLLRLGREVAVAETALPAAAVEAPMHGLMLCIRLLLADSRAVARVTSRPDWDGFGGRLISLCQRASAAVLPVVSSSSPEGHLPMEHSTEAVRRLGRTLQRALTPAGGAAVDDAEGREQADGGSDHVTAQMLLICSWRTMKEVCLLLGELSQQMPVLPGPDDDARLLTPGRLVSIGRHFVSLLAETKHRGAFEQAYIGFSRVCHTLWKSPLPELSALPARWLDESISDVRGEGRTTLCATRRSAGLPFLMMALLTSEPSVIGSPYFSRVMSSLLASASAGGETAVHAMNVLRALFRDSRLGESVGPFVSEGIQTALTGFRADTCTERNSAALLFSALVTRVFGVQRGRDTLCKKNCMTGRLFFLRYPQLYQFLLTELASTRDPFPVLLLLARLYPTPAGDSESQYKLTAFLPSLRAVAGSQVLHARLLAARAACALLPSSCYPEAADALLQQVTSLQQRVTSQNQLHGWLLQILHMLRHCVLENASFSAQDLLQWRPIADRCLAALPALLDPGVNPCPVTQAAAAEALCEAVRLGSLLSAPSPPPALRQAALRMLTEPSAALYGAETAQTAAVSLLWVLDGQIQLDVRKLTGYEVLQRHLEFMAERLDCGENDSITHDRLSAVHPSEPVHDLVDGEAANIADGNATDTDTPSSGRTHLPPDTAAALLDLVSLRRLPPPVMTAVLTVLRLLPRTETCSSGWSRLVQTTVRRLGSLTPGDEETVAEEALRTAAERQDEVRAAFIRVAVVVMEDVPQSSQEDRCSTLDAWCRLVSRACGVENSERMRSAGCEATAAALRWPPGSLSVAQEVSLWKNVMMLLVDDEASIRDNAAELIDHLADVATVGLGADDGDDGEGVGTESGSADEGVAPEDADCALRRGVSVFCRQMSGRDLRVTLRTLLEWSFTDDDGGQIGRREDEERVFDKGEMNIFSEDVVLVRASTEALADLLPELPEQPLLFPVAELAPLSLVSHLPENYELELSDILREAASQAVACLNGLALGVGSFSHRGYALACLRAFRRLKLLAVLREFFLDPAVDDLWQECVALLQKEICFPGLWAEIVDS